MAVPRRPASDPDQWHLWAGTRARELREKHEIDAQVVRHPRNRNVGRWHEGQLRLELPEGFVVLPTRWVVERSLAWVDRPRHMNMDQDRNLAVSTGCVRITEGRVLLRRLHPPPSNVLV